MEHAKLDCRGLACPHPVLKARELLESGRVRRLTVLVDNEAAKENVSRFLERAGFVVRVDFLGQDFAITGTREEEPALMGLEEEAAPELRKILVLLGTDRLGTGDDELGKRLMASFLGTLKEMGPELWCVVLLNAGVKLTVSSSPVLPELQELAARGVMVLVCGTCLRHFELLAEKQVGETTNMLDIVTHLQMADQVITLT